jgi:hypothetical protein
MGCAKPNMEALFGDIGRLFVAVAWYPTSAATTFVERMNQLPSLCVWTREER